MIAFLAPFYLIAAAAAAVPLLIHLLRRRIGLRIDFPAVRYLARAEREHSRKLRLRNLLLMLLRVAAVLLLALAAARPVTRVVGGGHAPTALAIVLDNSLSSSAIAGGHPVLDQLRDRARQVARRSAAGDHLWLVTADGLVRGGSRATVLDAIDRTEPLAGAGDPPAAAARAAALVRSVPFVEREVAVATDGQASSWRPIPSLAGVHLVVYRTPGAPPVNRAVTAARAVPPRWTPRGAIHARVQTPDSATYRITLEGRTLARGTVGRDEEIVVRAAPPDRGWVAGAVEIEPDELRGDDIRHVALWIGPAPAVAVQPSLGIFGRSAVDALVQAERITLGNDIAIAPADEAARLPALLIAPADPVRVGAANRQLDRLGVPWQLGALRRGSAAVEGDRLDGVTVTRRFALRSSRAAPVDTLARAGGDAWIVGGPGYVLIASPLIPDATDLPIRAAFVPWLGDVIAQRLSPVTGTVAEATPGAAVVRPPGADALEPATGQPEAIAGDTIAAPGHAGVYFFLHAGQRAGALVVNPEPGEAVLDRLDPGALRSRLGVRDAVVTEDSAAWAARAFASAPRRGIVAPLLVLALITLVTESALAGAGRLRAA